MSFFNYTGAVDHIHKVGWWGYLLVSTVGQTILWRFLEFSRGSTGAGELVAGEEGWGSG